MSDLYKAQKSMRQMRKGATQRGLVALLDIGTTKISCLLLRFTRSRGPGEPGYKIIAAASTRSRGVRFGEVEAMPETEEAIRTVIRLVQKKSGQRVDHAVACFSGARPRSYGLSGRVGLSSGTVAERDIGRVLAACEVPDIGEDRQILHAQPVNFVLDDRTGLTDPRGQIGDNLEVDMHLLTIESVTAHNIAEAVHRCDLELAGIASSAYVSGLSTLIEDEMETGAACIDLGGGTTGLSIFLKGHMIYADSIRAGGDRITQDISKVFRISLTAAERLKILSGGLYLTEVDERERLSIDDPHGTRGFDHAHATRADLIRVMQPRMSEILDLVAKQLDAAGFSHMDKARIILTGGVSSTPGLEALAQEKLGSNVRIGRPSKVLGLPDEMAGPDYAASVGLSHFAVNPQDEWWDFEAPNETSSERLPARVWSWVKENW
jgi:cell division protein FtsA